MEDVTRRGLWLLEAADWHDPALMRQLRSTDEHTHVDNVCGSGGANVPALNRLLAPLGIGFRSVAMSGSVSLGGRAFDYLSGALVRDRDGVKATVRVRVRAGSARARLEHAHDACDPRPDSNAKVPLTLPLAP